MIDEADIERVAAFIRQLPGFANATAERRADFAALYADLEGANYSKEWRREFARRVRDRVLWDKPAI